MKNFFATFISILITSHFAFAQIQNALDFDGIDDQVSVVNGSAMIAGFNQMSLTCWVYPMNANPVYPDFDGFAGIRNDLDADFYLVQVSATGVEARFRNSSGTAYDINYNGLLLNTWQQFVLTFDGIQLRLYHNGNKVDSIAASGGIVNNAVTFYAGNVQYYATSFFLKGKLDEVSLWNTAISPQQAHCLYQSDIDTSSNGLQLYFKFNEGIAGANNAGLIIAINEVAHIDGILSNFALDGSTSNWVDGIDNTHYTSATICQGDVYHFGGQSLTATGIYSETFLTVSGCDSLVRLTLSVTPVNASATQTGNTITANASGAIYQWVICDLNFAHLAGETNQSYTPSISGNYAVMVSQNGCTDTSSCFNVNLLGINENDFSSSIKLFPNPVDDVLMIEFGSVQKNISISINDVSGKELIKMNDTEGREIELDCSSFASGFYFIEIVSGNNIARMKVMKQ